MMNKKKKMIIIGIVVVAVAAVVLALVLMFGHNNELDEEFNEDKQIALERAGADNYTSPVLIIISSEDEIFGVTQLGNLVEVDNPDDLPVVSGVTASHMEITVDEEGVRHGTLKYPYIEVTDLPLYASEKNAPEAFAERRMKYLMNTTTLSAITDYKINSVEVTNKEGSIDGTGIISFELNVDVVPWRNSKIYGNPNENGWCDNVALEFDIWGTNGTWFLKGDDPITSSAYDYGDATDGMMRTFESQLFVNDTYSYRFACFDEEDMTITDDVPIRSETPDSEEANDDTSDEETPTDYEQYYAELYAIDTENNRIMIFEHGMHNFQYVFKDQYKGMLYLQTKEWKNNSEGNNRYLCVIDTNSNTFEKLLEYSLVIASTDDTMIVLGKRIDDDSLTARDLFAIDIASGQIIWESPTPYAVETENSLVCMGIYDGYLHVMYSADRIPFVVDITNGVWSYDIAA